MNFCLKLWLANGFNLSTSEMLLRLVFTISYSRVPFPLLNHFTSSGCNSGQHTSCSTAHYTQCTGCCSTYRLQGCSYTLTVITPVCTAWESTGYSYHNSLLRPRSPHSSHWNNQPHQKLPLAIWIYGGPGGRPPYGYDVDTYGMTSFHSHWRQVESGPLMSLKTAAYLFCYISCRYSTVCTESLMRHTLLEEGYAWQKREARDISSSSSQAWL